MKMYTYKMKTGIKPSREFAKKGLASHAVNIGLKCGHGCTYCSTAAMIRAHGAFKELGVSPFDNTYSIVDPTTPERVAHDAHYIRKRGLVQLCTIVDAWSPEAQQFNLGRKCLEAILSEPGWTVRILTKNAILAKDFDLIEKYRGRVLVGLSITATPDKRDVMSVIEPYASSIPDRIAALRDARTRGLRTYGMLCPLLPGIADSPNQIDELIKIATEFGSEEIFAEAVNPRGRGLILTQQALKDGGFNAESAAIASIRVRAVWSEYVTNLIKNLQRSVRTHSDIKKLKFLLYPKGLEKHDLEEIKQDDGGVVWLQ